MDLEYFEDYIEVAIKGKIYLVDKEYGLLFEHFEWYIGHNGYLQTKNNGKVLRYHSMIMDCPRGMVVDHINRNPYDNRKSNLRVCTQESNSRNKGPLKGKYKGVSWAEHTKRYRATVRFNGKQKHLGYYETEEEAAKAYNNFVEDNFDQYAYRNNI
jgi:hypothetical protein